MRIVFIGESRFSRKMLNELPSVVAVFSRREALEEDWDDLFFDCPDDADYHLVMDINAHASLIASYRPDLIYCLGFRQIIGSEILTIAPVIGYHPTLLPKMRGHCPIAWAIVNKLKETGSTFFLMDQGVDSGDILSQERVPVYPDDTMTSLCDRLIETARIQIHSLDISKRTPQDHSQATYMHMRIKGKETIWLAE